MWDARGEEARGRGWGGRGEICGAAGVWKCDAGEGDLRGAMERRVAGNVMARSAVWGTSTSEESRVHSRSGTGDRPGHRREHRNFLRAEWSGAAAAAHSTGGTDCECRPDLPWKTFAQ